MSFSTRHAAAARSVTLAIVSAALMAFLSACSADGPTPSSSARAVPATPTNAVVEMTGAVPAESTAPALDCVAAPYEPAVVRHWVFEVPVDAATLVDCSERHVGYRVASWSSDYVTRAHAMPGVTADARQVAAMAVDHVRCSKEMAVYLGSDRPTRFQSVLSFRDGGRTAVCDIVMRAADTYGLQPLPGVLKGVLSGNLWTMYLRCSTQIMGTKPGEMVRAESPCYESGVDARTAYLSTGGWLNPAGAVEVQDISKAVAAKCGGEFIAPDTIEYLAGGRYECWSQRRPKAPAAGVPASDLTTVRPGTCLDYTFEYAQHVFRAADTAVPCDRLHSALVLGSWRSKATLPPAGASVYEPLGQGSAYPTQSDWFRCNQAMWAKAGIPHLRSERGTVFREHAGITPRVSYLKGPQGVLARCDLIVTSMAKTLAPLPNDIDGVSADPVRALRYTECLARRERSANGRSYTGWVGVECADPGAHAVTFRGSPASVRKAVCRSDKAVRIENADDFMCLRPVPAT